MNDGGAAFEAWRDGLLSPRAITAALDIRALYGPEVDRACGVEEPAVDQWEAAQLYPSWEQVEALARLTGFTLAVGVILFVQLLFGAFVAGLNAGLVTNEWPLMNGRFFPEGVLQHRSLGDALLNDPFLIHFVHRWWAWVTVAALVVLARLARRAGDRRASIAIHSAFGIQILLGIATVMTSVNIPLAALHQLVGALLVASVAWGAHAIGRRPRRA